MRECRFRSLLLSEANEDATDRWTMDCRWKLVRPLFGDERVEIIRLSKRRVRKTGFGNLFAEVNSGHTSSTTEDPGQFAVRMTRGVESIQRYVFCLVSSAACRAAAKTAG